MKPNLISLTIISSFFVAAICAVSQNRPIPVAGAGNSSSPASNRASPPDASKLGVAHKPSEAGVARDDSEVGLQRTVAETTFLQSVAELLESNRTQQAKELLGLRLDGNIIAIDEMLSGGPGELQPPAQNLLRRVAAFRKQHPVVYGSATGSLNSNEIATINAKVKSILNKHDK